MISGKSWNGISKPSVLGAVIIVSGAAWYFSTGLTGNAAALLWIAPVPVLFASFNLSAKKAAIVSFISFLTGRLSWLGYLLTVVKIVPAVMFTLLFPVVFTLIVLATRYFVLRKPHWTSIFLFPTLWTSFEFITFLSSPDGTAGSLAYTQMNYLPVIQIASITGFLGITFFVTLVPAAFAMILHHFNDARIRKPALIAVISIIIAVCGYGLARLSQHQTSREITVGMISLDEEYHYDTADQTDIARQYAMMIMELAKRKAQIVVLPEAIFRITPANDSAVRNILVNAAGSGNVSIVAGMMRIRSDSSANIAQVLTPRGLLIEYDKKYLIKWLGQRSKPSKRTGLFILNGIPAGVAVCKDMDFPQYIRKYASANIVFVPAWDFRKDDWLHSRMAILRGVENGFSIARCARQGRLSLSDPYGRIIAETSTAGGNGSVLLGKIPVSGEGKLFREKNEASELWFGILNLLTGLAFFGKWFLGREKGNGNT
jgi:apolipoprotein N-acyltransferase